MHLLTGILQFINRALLLCMRGSLQIETVSEYMEAHFGYQYNMRWWCVLILFAYIIFVRVTSVLALKYCESQCWVGLGFTRYFLIRDHPDSSSKVVRVNAFCSRIHSCATSVQLVLRGGFCKPIGGVRLACRLPLTLCLQADRRCAVGLPLVSHPLPASLSGNFLRR